MRSSRWQQMAEGRFESVRQSRTRHSPDLDDVILLEAVIAVAPPFTDDEIASFLRCDPEDRQELTRLLEDRRGRHAVKWLIFQAGFVPEPLLAPTVRAGVHTVDPSYNKQFIWPCVASHGRRRVLEILLDLARHGSDLEKAGAANAWYWAEMPESTIYESQYYGLQPTRKTDDPVDDLLDQWAAWVVGEFSRSSNLDVRRSLVNRLPARYDADPAALRKAMHIGATHLDAYIRQRIAVQTGQSHVYPALPHRSRRMTPRDDEETGTREPD